MGALEIRVSVQTNVKSICFLLNSVNVVKVTLERCSVFNNILIIYDHRNVPNGWLPILIVVMVHDNIWAQACCYSTGEKKRRPFNIPCSHLIRPIRALIDFVCMTILYKFKHFHYIKTRREKWKSLFLVERMVFHLRHIFYSVIFLCVIKTILTSAL